MNCDTDHDCGDSSDEDHCIHSINPGQYGVDISTAESTSDLRCIKNTGYSYIIIRAYRSNGNASFIRAKYF